MEPTNKPSTGLQACIQELCEIADPELVRKWFSRWVRSVEMSVSFNHAEEQLRSQLRQLPNSGEASADAIRLNKEQQVKFAVGQATVKDYGSSIWESSEDADHFRSEVYVISLKGPLEEGKNS